MIFCKFLSRNFRNISLCWPFITHNGDSDTVLPWTETPGFPCLALPRNYILMMFSFIFILRIDQSFFPQKSLADEHCFQGKTDWTGSTDQSLISILCENECFTPSINALKQRDPLWLFIHWLKARNKKKQKIMWILSNKGSYPMTVCISSQCC